MKRRKRTGPRGNEAEKNQGGMYPSAQLLYPVCQAEYERIMEIRDKMYDRINIVMSFAGVVLLVILQNFDWKIFLELKNQEGQGNWFPVLVQALLSFISVVGIIWAEVELLLLIRGQGIGIVDSVEIWNQKLYKELPDNAAVWLMNRYTEAVSQAGTINERMQKKFNGAISKIAVSFLLYAILAVIEN